MFRLTIKTDPDNVALDDLEAEIANLLSHTADKVLAGIRSDTIHDSNGNAIGEYELTDTAS
jgi:hypothetical protein